MAEPNQIQIMPDADIYDKYMNNPGGMGFAPIGTFNPYGANNVNTASDAFYNFGKSDPSGLGASLLPVTLAAGAGALATNLLGNSNGAAAAGSGLGKSGALPWTSGLENAAPASPSVGEQVVKKAIEKFSDAGKMANTVEAYAGGHLQAAMDLGGDALNNALQFASEYGTPGNVPGMADFGAELSGLKGDAAKSIVENFHPESLADPIGEGLTSTYGSPAYEAAQASQLAGEGVSEAAATAISDATAAEAAIAEAATEFNITPKMLDTSGVQLEVEALNIADNTGFSAAAAEAGGFLAATTALEAELVASAATGPLAGMTAAQISGAMAGEMFGAMGVAQTAATTGAVTGGAATATMGATMAAAAPMVIPALMMGLKALGGASGGGGRSTWHSLFRVGDDNKIKPEQQGISKFPENFADLGETWFIDAINNAIDAGGIVWDKSVIGPDNGKRLGDFGWQPGHGMKDNDVGELGSPWFVAHDNLPKGYKGENPGTYFASEAEAAKMWLYINAKAGYMTAGNLQKSFDAIDAFEGIDSRGYFDFREGTKLLEGGGDLETLSPGEFETMGQDGGVWKPYDMSEGIREVAGVSGMVDIQRKLTKEELAEEDKLMAQAIKLQSEYGGPGRSPPIVIRETLNNYWVLKTHEYGDERTGWEKLPQPIISALPKEGVLDEDGYGYISPPVKRESLKFLPKADTSAKAAPKAAPKPAPKAAPKPAPKPKNYYGNDSKWGEVEPGAPVYFLLDSENDAASSGSKYKVGTGPRPDLPAGKWLPQERKNYAKYGSRTAPPPKAPPKPVPVVESKAKTGDVAKKASPSTGEKTLYWSAPDEHGNRYAKPKQKAYDPLTEGIRKGGKIGKGKAPKNKIPTSGLELPVSGGRAEPNSMKDDVPRTARSGDFVVNAKTVDLMGVPFFRKLIRSSLAKANKKGMKLSKTSVSKKEGVDIMVQNGEIRIPRELVKIIGLKKLRAWNNTGLRARGESPIAA